MEFVRRCFKLQFSWWGEHEIGLRWVWNELSFNMVPICFILSHLAGFMAGQYSMSPEGRLDAKAKELQLEEEDYKANHAFLGPDD